MSSASTGDVPEPAGSEPTRSGPAESRPAESRPAEVTSAADGPDPAEGGELPGQEYAVLVVDPQTAEVDVYGPFDGPEAVVDAARRREEHDRADLQDVLIQVTRLQRPSSLGRHSA